MKQAFFFPPRPAQAVEVSRYQDQVTQAHASMHTFLHQNVESNELKNRLHDQLIWLWHQIAYFTYCQDVKVLLENYNWVASNFNSELSLSEKELFKIISE